MSQLATTMKAQVVPVGLGECKAATGSGTLVCYGLGSCVGVSLYDPVTEVGIMGHIVLPDSTLGQATSAPAKFADTGVPRLVEEALKRGARKERLVVKLAGGAQMLAVAALAGKMDIGRRNAEAVTRALQAQGLTIAAADLGGNVGRTMQLQLPGGRVSVSTIGQGEKVL